jgi:hypothetical protein
MIGCDCCCFRLGWFIAGWSGLPTRRARLMLSYLLLIAVCSVLYHFFETGASYR